MKSLNKYFVQESVDKMTLPFTGVAGFNAWDGDAPVYQASASSPITLPSYIHDKWKTTIRTKNHMNGDDVINTLSNTWGGWKHGMGTTHLKISTGLFSNDKPELLEFQNYVSSDKKKFVGYVRNRTYNVRSRGCISVTFPELGDRDYFYIPNSISWNTSEIEEKMTITDLQNGEDYSIHWYSFKNGNYMKTDCLKATNGKIRLEFPTLITSTHGTADNPVLWFVAERSNCNQSRPTSSGDSTITLSREAFSIQQNTIYPNPFEDYFVVNSLENDVFILQSIDGTIIGNYKVSKGETRISKNLPKGIYIGTLLNQNQTFKIVKL